MNEKVDVDNIIELEKGASPHDADSSDDEDVNIEEELRMKAKQ